jgi:hypothetical protein
MPSSEPNPLSPSGSRGIRPVPMTLLGLALPLLMASAFLVWLGGTHELPTELAPPPAASMAPTPAPPPLSVVTVPVLYDLSGVDRQLTDQIPERIGDLGDRIPASDLPGLSFAFEATRGPVQVDVHGDTLTLTTELAYEGRGWYESGFFPTVRAGCPAGSTLRPRARVTLRAHLAIAPDWTLDPTLQVHAVEPLTSTDRDRCRPAGLQVDLTEFLMQLVTEALEGHLASMENSLSQVSLRVPADHAWRELVTPIGIGPEIWLALEPSGVALAGVSGEEGMEGERWLRAEVELQLQPRVRLGARPEMADRTLPDLSDDLQGRRGQATVQGEVSYTTLSQLLKEELSRQPLSFMGRQLHIEEARVWGAAGGALVIEIQANGPLSGRLWLAGTPRLDPESGEIRVPDLELFLAQGNILARLAMGTLRPRLTRMARDWVAWAPEEWTQPGTLLAAQDLSHTISPNMRLEGSLAALELSQIQATPGALLLHSTVEGTLRLRVEGA